MDARQDCASFAQPKLPLFNLSDGCEFRRNKHHITLQQPGAKSSVMPQSPHLPHEQSQSYNLRPRKHLQSVKWPHFPTTSVQGEFNLPSELRQ